ncbi:proteasome assembly chaperone 4 [Nephila pilipes]|uniref:Proteasome assembly chaperone 4 n=1 Tax=Nephila pilipes TaxID=299642 RepID=A0A8X6PD95_NEPPI|nr:proteasome assembly chaperone 4 [Nephila pilipes]
MANTTEEPLLKTHTFEDTLLDCHVIFHVIKMKDSLFLWIGDQGNFDSLAVAMKTPYSTSPVSSALMGHSADDYSCSLAAQLSERIKMQVFASYNLSRSDSNFITIIARRLIKEITDNPNKF